MNDSIVTPENTKLIAEWMGYETRITDGLVEIALGEIYRVRCFGKYNPITNAEQSREVEKKLLGLGYEISQCGRTFTSFFNDTTYSESITLELTIYTAALYEAKK